MKSRVPFLALLFLLVPLVARAQDKSVASVLKPYIDAKSLAGAVVLVADKDKVLALDTIGYANVEDNTLMGPSAVFWIASMSKPITGLALMMLIDEGKVNLDDPVEKYLPEFKDVMILDEDKKSLRKPKTTITVRMIMNHTSGLPFKTAQEEPTLDKLTLAEAVKSYVATPLIYEPATKSTYSNAGINTGGRIIEVVSGMPYETFMDKRVFEPLGMKDTTFWPNDAQIKRLATSYRPNKAKDGLEATKVFALQYPLNDRKRQPMPAGGYFSTANDLARLCQMVLNGGTFEGMRYLSEKAVKDMTTRPADVKSGFGVGWATSGDTFGHGGAYATNMQIDTKRGLITVFLVQHNGFPGEGGKSLGTFRKAAEERFGK